MTGRRWWQLFQVIAGLVVLLLPAPEGLSPNAWRYFPLFVAAMTGIATEPEALRAVAWPVTAAGLRHLRRELIEFLLAALRP